MPAIAKASGQGYFCPSSGGGDIFLHGYGQPGDRCTQWYYSLIHTQANNLYSYYTCADVKPNADGSGGDVFPAVCAYGYADMPLPYAVADYATVINHQGAGHSGFSGFAYWTG